MRSTACGFHLIELVVSLAVIALLVQLAVPHFTQPIEKKNQVTYLSLLLNIQLSLERCYVQKNSYLACKKSLQADRMAAVTATVDTYQITLLSDTPNTPCYRWQINQENKMEVFDKGGVVKNCM